VAGVCPFAVISRGVLTAMRLSVALPVRPVESVAVIVAGKVPGCVGVPTTTPVDWSKLRPVGRPLAIQEYGGVPPETRNVMELLPFGGWTYAVPTMNWKLLGA